MSANSFKNKTHLTHILIKGARVHNLKNIDVAIPRNKITVVTGLSGSGKSSLAFDTLYAEGQRRYVESLSSYARQFLGKLDKPDVDAIKGISPAIAIEQKVNSSNSRSTVGTSTEIYDYLKLLFARIGRTYSPISGNEVKKDKISDLINYIETLNDNTKYIISSPINIPKGRTVSKQLGIFIEQGFSRVVIDNKIESIDNIIKKTEKELRSKPINLLIDRLVKKDLDNEEIARISESLETAFIEGEGYCSIIVFNKNEILEKKFSNKFELDGMTFTEPSLNFFTFNNPLGACSTCEGMGKVIGIDKDLVVPDKKITIYEGAIACWRGEKMKLWNEALVMNAHRFNFPIHKPFYELTEKQIDLLWKGNEYFGGLDMFFKDVESQLYKIQYRVMLSRYRGKTDCRDCKGSRLRKDANYVKINGYSITDIAGTNIDKAKDIIRGLELNSYEKTIAKQILIEIQSRLDFLSDVGLGYLSLSRMSNTLSGGESQRINLATSLGSSLVGAMYILDEPSIGLHPRDTLRLLKVLKALKNIGNTVIIVEHEEEVMKVADEIIDIGPMAGVFGGEVVFQGNHKDLIKEQNSITAKYLTNRLSINIPKNRRSWNKAIKIEGARENNLKNITLDIPLECLVVVTGVSGSGKSTLIKKILYPALAKIKGKTADITGVFDNISGNINDISEIEFVDQNPIGKTSRSTPVTYVKAYDEIRILLHRQQLSKINGFTPGIFSFNIAGGRCDACEGEGEIKVPMQFMADVYLECDVCEGKRFKDEVLEVKYRDKNIYDILTMTVDKAIEFFSNNLDRLEQKIIEKIKPLQDIGLGYIKLGQPGNTLSGGEAQRVKLASFLSKKTTNKKTLFIFDEPTTGLHFHDIDKLLTAIYSLLDLGHSVLIIEHNIDVVKCADWIIDLGPEGGEKGGNIVFEGVPEDLINVENSYTAKYLNKTMTKTI